MWLLVRIYIKEIINTHVILLSASIRQLNNLIFLFYVTLIYTLYRSSVMLWVSHCVAPSLSKLKML